LIFAFNTLQFPFLWDDFDFLGRASRLHLRDLLPDPSIVFYRPLSREVYFWVVTHLLGTSPLFAHILNAAVACGILALLVDFVRRLAGPTAGLASGLVVACSAALPLAVGWISASQDLLCGLFVLLGLRLQLDRKPLAAALAMGAALLSKETAIAVIPSAVVLSLARRDRSRLEVTRTLAALGVVIVAWVAIHPWTRSLLAGSHLPLGAHKYLFRGGSLGAALLQGVVITLNDPWIVHTPRWPDYLIVPALIVSAMVYLLLQREERERQEGGIGDQQDPRVALIVGSSVFLGSLALTSLVLGGWSPHYVCVPVIGLAMLSGPALARTPLPARVVLLLGFLWLGLGLRGNPIDPIVPTEPNFNETAGALEKVERGFKALHPTLPAGSNVFVSVQARQSGGLYRHLFRFQPLRVWYHQQDLWVLDPNRRRQALPNEFLFWIAPDLSVYEIRLTDLAPHGPTAKVELPQYQKTLRGYALGLAGAGQVDRAVYILANMPQNSKDIWTFDRRIAVALFFAANRPDDAKKLETGVPSFPFPESADAVVALLSEPITGLDLDQAAMRAFGLDPNDPKDVRDLMERLEASSFNLAAGRFARRLLELIPGDSESAAVLLRVAVKPSEEITVPIPYDIPQ
jgi:hypothetical protein